MGFETFFQDSGMLQNANLITCLLALIHGGATAKRLTDAQTDIRQTEVTIFLNTKVSNRFTAG